MKAQIIIELESEDQIELENRMKKYEKIFLLLIQKGALDGVRGGSTKIHFDGEGKFMGIELDYWPFRERNLNGG